MKAIMFIALFAMFLAACAPQTIQTENTPNVPEPEETVPDENLAPVEKCVDYDNGKVYDIPANVEFEGQTYRDRCTQEKVLKEYYCEDDELKSILKSCDSCDDGVCLVKDKGCTDSDDGIDPDNKGTVVDANGKTSTDECNSNGKTLTEYFCDVYGFAEDNIVQCNKCVDGQCV